MHSALQWAGIPMRRTNTLSTWGSRCPLPAPSDATGSCHRQHAAQIDNLGGSHAVALVAVPVLPPGQLPASEVPRFPYVGLHAALNWMLSSLLSLPSSQVPPPTCCSAAVLTLQLASVDPWSTGDVKAVGMDPCGHATAETPLGFHVGSLHCCRLSSLFLLGCRHSLPS